MAQSRLTIGMATYRDFDGVYFSINALRLYHAEVMDRCEFVVIDNDPDGPQSERLRDFLKQVSDGASIHTPPESRSKRELPQPFNVQYIASGGVQGTSAPRDEIFRVATGDAVLVIDSHVNIWPRGISRLLRFFDERPTTEDLFQGPLLMDSFAATPTHFDDVWRGGMWGTWGTAWRRDDGRLLSARQTADQKVALYDLLTNQEVTVLPLDWSGHESSMSRHGLVLATYSEEPFEIPAQGLGLFACRRAEWLGFNPKFREFGGEEWYIHSKFRQAGHKCYCLPWLKWTHRFAAPAAGRSYARSIEAKVRNYIIGLTELGLPLDRLRRHFVDGLSEDPSDPNAGGGRLSSATWDRLVDEAAGDPLPSVPRMPYQPDTPTAKLPVEDMLRFVISGNSEANAHCAKLRDLASQCDTVVQFGPLRTAHASALLAGQPGQLIACGPTPPRNMPGLQSIVGSTHYEFRVGDSLSVQIPPCDLLYIDTKHTAEQRWAELERHRLHARRYIVLFGTAAFGTRGEDGQEGLFSAVRRLMTEHPEWAVVHHSMRSGGLTVLSRVATDHPQKPIRLWPVGHGPGTELKAILASLGIHPAPSCDCHNRAIQMDEWGVHGCRERRDEIIGWLREGQSRWGWKEKLSAAARAVTTGLAARLNPLDVFPSLVDEAIQRAESKQTSC